ncbi:MAG: GGDEF domain-containing protein [Lachnospiraceae bacterium]|nr:GGDEF domain-containing protein [Lachnospiraceae bacterium]
MSKGLRKTLYVIVLLVVITLIIGFFALIKSTSQYRVTDFHKGWTVAFRGQEYEDVDLEKFRFPGGCKKGEYIVLKNHLPFSMKEGSAIIFPLELSAISVDVGDTTVYEYGSDRFAKGYMVGSGVHIIRIPDLSQGRLVTVTITAGENKAFTYLSGIFLDETNWGLIDYLNDNIYPVALSLSLVMAGIIILVISFIIAFKKYEWVRINQMGVLFFTMGCWTLCETNTIQLFSADYVWNTFVRYFFGIFSILPVLRMITGAHKDKPEADRYVQKVVFSITHLLIVATAFLSLLREIHICNVSLFFQIFAFLSMAVACLMEWKDYPMEDIAINPRFVEHLMCFIFIAVETVRNGLHRFFNFQITFLRHSFLLYGTVVLVMMMMSSYIYDLYESYLRRAEENTLKRLAFTDGLTGLLNRAFCKDKMEELDRSGKEFHMISFDVNGLKEINDNRGHPEGDRLLTTFADILTRCFSDIAYVIRPGGDEFLVISDDAGKQELLGRLDWLDSMEKNAEKSLGFPVKAAYGLAGSDEVDGHSTEEVYYLADQRMYDMKVHQMRNP